METFDNKMNPLKFKSTNFIWNRLGLNHPWSVGYVSTLIEAEGLKSKEDWKQHYYKSGEERLRLIESECTPEEKEALMDFTKTTAGLSKRCKELNTDYGRTEAELDVKGKYMYEKILEDGNPKNLTLAECCYMVKYRILGETWNGIMAREHNTIKTLQNRYPELQFVKVTGERDYMYGIDYELSMKNELLCAIQIKPISYLKGFSKEIVKAKKTNQAKNMKYKNETSADVIYVYSNSKGQLLNELALFEINTLLHSKGLIPAI